MHINSTSYITYLSFNNLCVGFASKVVHVSQWVLLHVGILSVVYVGEVRSFVIPLLWMVILYTALA